jgi:hypothetical protein
MEHVHSILIIKDGNKYYNYYDNRWNMLLFPNIKGNNIDDIKKYLLDTFNISTDNITLLFDKVHDKYSIPHEENRTYHHYFYYVDIKLDDNNYYTLDELLEDDKVKENNSDIVSYIKEYYNE